MRGMYSVFLELWQRFLGKDHILVIKSEVCLSAKTSNLSFFGLVIKCEVYGGRRGGGS